MASVLRVTWDRREVRNKVTPTYPMTSSMTRISPSQVGPPVDLPGTPPQPWMLLQPWAIQKMRRYAGCAGVRSVNTTRKAKAGSKARIAAQQKTRRDRETRLGLAGPKNRRASSGSPASSSTGAIALNRPSATWPTPGCGQAAHAAKAAATANSAARTSRRGSSASRASTQAPPARQASRASPGGTSCASAQTASAQSRRPAGSSHAKARATAAITRVSLLMEPPPTAPRPAAAGTRCHAGNST